MLLPEGYAEDLDDVLLYPAASADPAPNLADCWAGVYPAIRRISDADRRSQSAGDRCG
jgi:hypothetical protein